MVEGIVADDMPEVRRLEHTEHIGQARVVDVVDIVGVSGPVAVRHKLEHTEDGNAELEETLWQKSAQQ